jgi:hypothetical protein
MQITTLGTIAIDCALAGALVGGIVAMRTRPVYAASATMRLPARERADAECKLGLARHTRAAADALSVLPRGGDSELSHDTSPRVESAYGFNESDAWPLSGSNGTDPWS